MPNENNVEVLLLNEKPSKLELYEPTKTIEIIERVTSVDDSLYKVPPEYDNNLSRNLDASVTPYAEQEEEDNELGMEYEPRNNNSLTLDWSIPDPPSGFKDSITPTLEKDISEVPEAEQVPVNMGPMKFSINSYTERTLKEEPYNLKLSRAESFRDSVDSIRNPDSIQNSNSIRNPDSITRLSSPNANPEKPTIPVSKSESFSLTRFNADSTISGNNKKCFIFTKKK